MTKEEVLVQIEKEFATARHAEKAGNDGMVRVCARRAAGIAIRYWLEHHPRNGWGKDAMNLLRSLQREDSMPEKLREAAQRLTAKVTPQFTSQFAAHPLDDSKLIIDHLMQ